MNVSIFNFAIKYRKSQNKLLRLAAELCIAEGKREADRIERKLSQKQLKQLSQKNYDRIRDSILRD